MVFFLSSCHRYDEGNADLLAIRREIRAHGKFIKKAKSMAAASASSESPSESSSSEESSSSSESSSSPPEERNDLEASEPVQHALRVMAAVSANNYAAVFRLMRSTPNDGNRILGRMETKLRVAALRVMIKAYKPLPLSLAFVKAQLFEARDPLKFVADFCSVLGLVVEDRPLLPATGGETTTTSTTTDAAAAAAATGDETTTGGGGGAAPEAMAGAVIDTKKSAGKSLSIENVDTWLGVARGSLL